jgi:hypothetical protein
MATLSIKIGSRQTSSGFWRRQRRSPAKSWPIRYGNTVYKDRL